VTGFELPRRAEIEAAARAVYSHLGIAGAGAGGVEGAASLGRMLLGPVAGRLGKRRLIVVADGDLQYLPFGMLPAPREEGARATAGTAGAPLLVEHEIVSVPSASVVAAQRRGARRAPAEKLAAVLADPVFDARDPRVTAAAGRQASPSGNGGRSRAGAPSEPFSRLPWTGREAAAIAAVAPAGGSLLALGFEASRETALSPALARYRIVHFATHGVIDTLTPALSGLMLSRIDEQGAAREGFLGLADIYNLRLGADLVVLSGCETALGKQVNGEGLVGLTQGFLYGGARQVVASLWRVEDRATAELMSRFYRGLLVERRPAAAALRLAQLAIRRDRRWRSPYYWSGFLAQGDWR
jgi:CHAT domain-containing protein